MMLTAGGSRVEARPGKAPPPPPAHVARSTKHMASGCKSGRCGSRPEDLLPRDLLCGAFVLQSVVVFASNAGYLGGLTNVEVGDKYKPLFMPAGWAFAIWGVIYAWECVAYATVLFAPHPSPQLEAAAPFLVAANVAQLLWAVAFCRERLYVSTVFIVSIAAALCLAAEELRGSPERFTVGLPVSIHAGWVAAASLVNVNLCFVAAEASKAAQVAAAFASAYGALVPAALLCATRGDAPFAAATAWALVAVGVEVARSPSAADDTAVARAALRQTAFVLAAVLAWLAASAVVFEYAEGWHDEL